LHLLFRFCMQRDSGECCSEMSYRTLVRKAAARLVAEVEESRRKKKVATTKPAAATTDQVK
jgi:hypothetical protein